MDELRDRLKKNAKFDAYSCFQALDSKSDGYMDREDIIVTFRKEGAQVIRENEIQMIIERYERKPNRDGKITYSEFFSEMRPRFINW
jgi:Ca2+-binding EF-hand superfamily protein